MTSVTEAYTRYNNDKQADIPVIRDTIPRSLVHICTISKIVTVSTLRVITILLLPSKKEAKISSEVFYLYTNVHEVISHNSDIIITAFV
jgi:hypothetical protein